MGYENRGTSKSSRSKLGVPVSEGLQERLGTYRAGFASGQGEGLMRALRLVSGTACSESAAIALKKEIRRLGHGDLLAHWSD